jgi:hypothetical protein
LKIKFKFISQAALAASAGAEENVAAHFLGTQGPVMNIRRGQTAFSAKIKAAFLTPVFTDGGMGGFFGWFGGLRLRIIDWETGCPRPGGKV